MSAGLRAVLMLAVLLPFGGSAHRRTAEGNAHYLDGLYDEALRAYTEAQVDAPEAPQLYYDIGNVLYRQGDYEGAAEAYTRALLSVVPVPNPRLRHKRIILSGETPDPVNLPTGCRFHPRCPLVVDACRATDPALRSTGLQHEAACLLLE